MNWQVTFYSNKVEQTTLSFPHGILTNFLHIAEMIEEFGPALGLPYTKAIGEGLFEIRAKGKEGIGNCQEKVKRGEIMRTSLKDFKKKAFKDPEVKKEYDRLAPAYELRKQLIRIRKDAGFTQEELAELLHTKKSNISRLENVNSKISPKLSTIEEYARAVGYKLEINFIPQS